MQRSNGQGWACHAARNPEGRLLSTVGVGEVFVVGAGLCVVGHFIASLTSTHQTPTASSLVVTPKSGGRGMGGMYTIAPK